MDLNSPLAQLAFTQYFAGIRTPIIIADDERDFCDFFILVKPAYIGFFSF